MARATKRRRFLKFSAAGGAALGLGDLAFLAELPPVSAEQAEVNPGLVRLDAGIEPLVRLIEDTPRSDLLEVVARRIRRGVTYHEVVAALFLASVRNVQPRPSVGFKFHAVLVVNSALIASLSSPESDRWLPIFWALDEFKNSQADEKRKGGWRMKPVDESTVPAAHEARKAFVEAMESWDEKRADGAVAGLVRTGGANEIYDLFCRFGGRDFRSIGHKAIFVANSWRTLQFIGWQHAEPVLRSLAFALLNHGLKDTTPAKSDEAADRPWRRNQELATKMGSAWMGGKLDEGATRDMLAAFREGSNDDACDKAVKLIGRGVSPQSIWDALFVGAGELLVRQPGIVALHSVTATNALRYSFRSCGDDRTRKLLLLQTCAFLPMFRGAMKGRGKVRDTRIDDVQPRALNESSGPGAIEEIFGDLSGDRMNAAGKVRQYLEDGGSARDLINAARRLIFMKGRNHHDYKFSSAVLEDYFHVSPAWRDRFLASSVFNLKGSRARDNSLVGRIRAAMKA